MNLHTALDRQLVNLESTGQAGLATALDGPRRLTCELADLNALAVSLHRLELATTELATADAARLERIGQSLAARLTYLMEPIRPIEIDAAACTVQLRSNPPQRDDDGRTYYELLVRRGGSISLTRFRKQNQNVRQQVTATITREVLLRLVADLESALD